MYADQLEAQPNRSVKDRLNGNFASAASGRRPVAGKRRREDDGKWEHDLFQDDEPAVSHSNRSIRARDLRLKLQRKNIIEIANQSLREFVSGTRDLREKLSGTLYTRPSKSKLPTVRKNPVSEVRRPTPKSVIVQASNPETNTTNPKAKKPVQQGLDSVDSFLQSLGLEKYSITLKAEEVDMTALLHMKDEDLKALGIPMGPRKKILLELESRSDT